MRGVASLVLCASLVAACLGGRERPWAPASADLELVGSTAVLEFYARASAFYTRLARRRFNTLATYEDRVLRGYFLTETSYADYYADLADDLDTRYIERSRPLSLEVEEFLVDGPGRARVRVRIEGEHALPLRFWRAKLEREDRWERQDGQWWIIPGKL